MIEINNLSYLTDSQPCSRIFVENSHAQPGREGVYEKINDVICTVRPVYRHIWPNFIDVQYLFFSWASNKWVIGDTYQDCNETFAEFHIGIRAKDGSSSPDKVTQPWFNFVSYVSGDRWEENEELTVICDGEYMLNTFDLGTVS